MTPASSNAGPVQGRKRTALLFFDQALVSGGGFLTMLVLIRNCGLGVYGAFSMVWTLALFVVGLQLALISQPMMTIGPAQAPEDRARYFGSVLTLQAAFSVLAAIGCAVAYRILQGIWADPLLEGTILPGTALVLARQGYVFFRNYYFTTGQVVRAVCNDACAFGGQLVSLVVLASRGALTLDQALWAIAACFSLATLAGFAQFERVVLCRTNLVLTALRSWRFSRWLVAQTVFQWVSANAFVIAAGGALGSAAVGALKLAHNVIGVLGVVLVTLENFVPVDAARTFAASGLAGLKRYLRRVLLVGGSTTAVAAAAIALWPHLLLRVLYGADGDPWAVQALRLFACLYVLAFAITILSIAFRSVERTRELALCNILISLPVFVIAHPVVEHFGFAGACLGMVLHKAVLAIALGCTFLWVTRDRTPRDPRKTAEVAGARAPASAA